MTNPPLIDVIKQLEFTVASWPGVRVAAHRFGGVEFLVRDAEVGHIHGNGYLDIPFPRKVRDEVIAAGLAEEHHILPDTGWITKRLRSAKDLDTALDLLRRSYERYVAKYGLETTLDG